MEQNFKLEEVMSGSNVVVSDILFESKTAKVKGFLAGASLVGASWVATSLYKKFKRCKINKTVDPQEDHEID